MNTIMQEKINNIINHHTLHTLQHTSKRAINYLNFKKKEKNSIYSLQCCYKAAFQCTIAPLLSLTYDETIRKRFSSCDDICDKSDPPSRGNHSIL